MSLTVTVDGPATVVALEVEKSEAPAYAPPRPAAPPTIAAATMMPTTLPAPTFCRPAGAAESPSGTVCCVPVGAAGPNAYCP